MAANIYYWRAVPNWGDRLGLDLLEHFTGVPAQWSEMEFADVIVTGSTLDQVPAGWSGIVAGPGIIDADCQMNLTSANVAAVRGPMTLDRVTCDRKKKVVLGDPGLLADELVDVTTRDHQLGILPHWRDTRLANVGIFQQYNPLVISPFDDPKTVIAQVGRCQKLVTSSLHGLILADSFGIPRRFELNPFTTPDEGGVFKYQDYSASISLPLQVGVTQQADRNLVTDVKHRLFDMFDKIGPKLP